MYIGIFVIFYDISGFRGRGFLQIISIYMKFCSMFVNASYLQIVNHPYRRTYDDQIFKQALACVGIAFVSVSLFWL